MWKETGPLGPWQGRASNLLPPPGSKPCLSHFSSGWGLGCGSCLHGQIYSWSIQDPTSIEHTVPPEVKGGRVYTARTVGRSSLKTGFSSTQCLPIIKLSSCEVNRLLHWGSKLPVTENIQKIAIGPSPCASKCCREHSRPGWNIVHLWTLTSLLQEIVGGKKNPLRAQWILHL